MPNPAARPFYDDLQFLGKVRQYARNCFRDEQLDISDCGEKGKSLIKEYLFASDVKALHQPISNFGA